MSTIDLTLTEYDEALNAFGHADPRVVALKRELLSYQLTDINDLVRGIDDVFDNMVFNNQTEGRF